MFEKTTPYLLKEKEKAAKEHDLEVWRQAYNAAIACDSDAPVSWKTCADMALADYRAKREEMGI